MSFNSVSSNLKYKERLIVKNFLTGLQVDLKHLTIYGLKMCLDENINIEWYFKEAFLETVLYARSNNYNLETNNPSKIQDIQNSLFEHLRVHCSIAGIPIVFN